MYRGFAIIVFALTQLTGSVCFKFPISRDLNSSKELEKTKWTQVEVTTIEASVKVKFDIPAALSYSDIFIFFANIDKNILQVKLNETIQGKFYTAPHAFEKEMPGEKMIRNENGNFLEGIFPKAWLPEKCNKVSAAVVSADGRYYNYYKIQNFQISLPDLMVVEEYKKCEFD